MSDKSSPIAPKNSPPASVVPTGVRTVKRDGATSFPNVFAAQVAKHDQKSQQRMGTPSYGRPAPASAPSVSAQGLMVFPWEEEDKKSRRMRALRIVVAGVVKHLDALASPSKPSPSPEDLLRYEEVEEVISRYFLENAGTADVGNLDLLVGEELFAHDRDNAVNHIERMRRRERIVERRITITMALVGGTARLEFTRGPDGRRYVTGGRVVVRNVDWRRVRHILREVTLAPEKASPRGYCTNILR